MNPLLRPEAVAEIFGCSKRTVLRWAETGELGHVRIGKVVRFRPDDVERFVEEHRGSGGQAAPVVRLEGRGASS